MKKFLSLILALVTIMSLVSTALADNKSVKTDGKLSVDVSHSDQGYIMVKSEKSKKKLKVRVTYKDTKNKNKDKYLNYDLNNGGDYEVFPLQFGNGKYTIVLFAQEKGKMYKNIGTVSLDVKLENRLSSFLYPNQYVNYDDETPCVVTAGEICEGMTDQAQIYKTICNYIKGHFVYDFIKSVSVKAGVLPDINGCWEKHMGICQDLAAVCCAMMRSQGIPAVLVIGTADGDPHSWVTAVVEGNEVTFDPAEVLTNSTHGHKEVERYY